MTKKEIVKQISDRIGLTQLKTKDIVQQTFDAIVETLLEVGRIELRNFGVFEVKKRKARKARNPRTGDKVDVPPKFVVTFKPGKEMEERVRQMKKLPGQQATGRGTTRCRGYERSGRSRRERRRDRPQGKSRTIPKIVLIRSFVKIRFKFIIQPTDITLRDHCYREARRLPCRQTILNGMA